MTPLAISALMTATPAPLIPLRRHVKPVVIAVQKSLMMMLTVGLEARLLPVRADIQPPIKALQTAAQKVPAVGHTPLPVNPAAKSAVNVLPELATPVIAQVIPL